jgi:hypothetical protein
MRPRRWLCILTIAGLACAQPKYTGPKPPRQDLPYLVHGDSLLALESTTAAQQDRKDDTLYVIAGETSTVKTPLSSPVFVLDSAKIDPSRLALYRLESKGGHREIAFRKKGKSNLQPIGLSVSVISGTLYRVEVIPTLDNGEYSLTPDGSNQVFCFTVF